MSGRDPDRYHDISVDDGLDWPNEYGQSIPEDTEEKEVPVSVRSREVFSFADFSVFRDDLLIINDVVLADIPTTAIAIEAKNNVFIAETLRTHSPIVTSNGIQDWTISLSLHFPVGTAQTTRLHRIISQILRHPLVFVFNNYIRKVLNVTDPSVTTMFVVESGVLRNSPDTVGDIILDLTLHYFNYKPFSNHFWFNAKLQGYNKDDTAKSQIERPVDLSPQGYEASSYSLEYTSEKIIKDIRNGVLTFDTKDNVPINFPAASDAWMYYADHLSRLTPNVSERTSDYIGFGLRVYEHHNPPRPEQRDGAGLAKYEYNTEFTYPDYANVYNVMAGPTDPEVPKTNSMRQADKATAPPVDITIDAGNEQLATYTHKGRTVQIDDDTALWLARMLVGEGGKGCSSNKAGALMWCMMNRFMYMRRGWGSFRELLKKFSQPINDRWVPGGDLWNKWKAIEDRKASKNTGYRRKYTNRSQAERRLRIQSLAWSDIPSKIRGYVNQFRQGTFPVPSSIANLKRPRITNFASHAGLKEKYPHGIAFSQKTNPDWFFEEDGLRPGILTIIPPKNTAKIKENSNIAENFTEDDLVSDELSTQSIDPELVSQQYPEDVEYIKRDQSARRKWIRDMENTFPPLFYYEVDPKVRNVFFSNVEFHVSSNLEEQRANRAAKNIVLSAISVSFGHRIVPQKLASQDIYTYQFLGAGNRSGTLVFTFAGEEGKISANKLKAIMNAARDNARVFGNLIQDAGSVDIYYEKGLSKERNTILALLDINTIVITDISESTSSDSAADKHQLIVNFVVQDFAEEKYDARFFADSDSNRRIIKGIVGLLAAVKPKDGQWKPKEKKLFGLVDGAEIRDWQRIYPHPKYVIDRTLFEKQAIVDEIAHFEKTGENIGGFAKPYRRDPSFPGWLAEILVKATEYCREIDDAIPPTTWKISKETNQTWKDKYGFYGAGDLIKGRVVNIAKSERNQSMSISISSGVDRLSESQNATVTFQWDEMYAGKFQYDGEVTGSNTNELHARKFNKWLNKMSILVDEVRKNVSDEENFKLYFGTVGNEVIDQLLLSEGNCYEDMFLPDAPHAPDLKIPLPPEFYVYDDSYEDQAFLTVTDDTSMSALLEKHIENEVASIERYVMNTALGGSYLSRNLPHIIEERKQYLDTFGGTNRKDAGWSNEIGFLNFSDMMTEGTKVWEPVYYRPNDPSYDREGIQSWINKISNDYGQGDKAKFSFMDNLIKLSPYLRDGHNWKAYNSAPPDYLIETLYDEDWRDTTFGPNPSYTYVDTVMTGNPIDPISQESFDRAKNRPVQEEAMEGESRESLANPELLSTNDGAYTVGKSYIENMTEIRERYGTLQPEIKDPDQVDFTTGGPRARRQGNVEAIVKAKDKKEAAKRIEEVLDDYTHPIANLFAKDGATSKIAQLATGIAKGSKSKDLSIRRVYPAFKIYFIEDDEHETEQVDGKIMRAFDDFYSYSAVQEIRISRSRKIAADMAIIRMTNVGGKLFRKRFGDNPQWDSVQKAISGESAEYSTGIFAETEKENPFEDMVLQDGVKVQIRLGYANNVDDLESVFLGSIVEIQPAEGGKLIEIVCQGFGAELEGVELGPLENGPIFYSSQQVLSGAIIQDSIVNFGRRSKFNRFSPGEARHAFTGGEGRGFLSSLSPGALLDTWGRGQYYRHFYRYSFRNYPQDDNIFAPPPEKYANSWERFYNNACTYRPLKQTPWQIFKEHELRHPGYIAAAVPYGHSSRMTMFFGAKGQHYWSRPPSALELFLAENAADTIIQLRGMSQQDILKPEFMDRLTKIATDFPKIATAIAKGATGFSSPISVSTEMARIFGRYRPFRNYHYFDSTHHILKNSIRTSLDGVYNQIDLLYFEDEDKVEGDAEEIQNNLRSFSTEGETFSCKLDDNIPEEYIRSYREEYPSCITEFMAKRYTQGLFARLLRDAYKGDLVVLGEPTLKPYDIVYLNDTSINMTGPIEVEAVEHIFNRDHGFISIVTPDLCVDINDFYSASVFDVIGTSLSYMWLPGLMAVAAPPLAPLMAVVGGLGLLALVGGVKIMNWMQEGSPVITTPLTLGGKPFLSVGLGQKRSSLITSIKGKWNQYWDDLKVGLDKFDINETMFDARLSVSEKLLELYTADPGESIPEF